MSKLTPAVIRDLALAGDSFGFEMRIGKIVRSIADAEVQHTGTFTPLGLNEAPRQFDYRVYISREDLVLQLAIECKSLFIGSPVVVCGSARSEAESRHDLVVSDARFIAGRRGLIDVGLISTSKPSAFYPAGHFVGKTVIRPEPTSVGKELVAGSGYRLTGDSDIYDRWNQAVLHACWMLHRAMDLHAREQSATFAVTLPIVVLPNETLWRLTYDSDGVVLEEPTMVDHETLFLGRRQWLGGMAEVTGELSHLHFVTQAGLEAMVRNLNAPLSKIWSDAFPIPILHAYQATRNDTLVP